MSHSLSARLPAQLINKGLLIIIALMPFHAFLTTWIGANLGNRLVWQSWKELLIGGLALAFGWLLISQAGFRKFIVGYKLNWLIVGYGLLHLLMLLGTDQNPTVIAYALRTNLVFFGLFMIAQTISYFGNPQQAARQLGRIILISGLIVGLFASTQGLLLPADWLRHFGYGENSLQPFLVIEGNDYVRVLSTLGGPNQLGQFLVLPLTILASQLARRFNWAQMLLAIPMLLGLYFSYSRSAWIGLLVALAVVGYIHLSHRLKKQFVIGLTALVVLLGLAIFQFRNNLFVRSVLLHTGQTPGISDDSDSERWSAIQQSLQRVGQRPLGYGPGSAGPAVLRDSKGDGIISENYYLQIALEVGIIGLIILVSIVIYVATALWQRSRSLPLATALLASLAGISIINLFLHGWTDSTIALVWWGSAGAIMRSRQ